MVTLRHLGKYVVTIYRFAQFFSSDIERALLVGREKIEKAPSGVVILLNIESGTVEYVKGFSPPVNNRWIDGWETDSQGNVVLPPEQGYPIQGFDCFAWVLVETAESA